MDDLGRAQETLSRILARARAGEDRELAQKVRELGEQAAHSLAGLIKMSRVHAADNRAFDAPASEFGKALGTLLDRLGPVRLVAVEDQLYVNDVRIRTEGASGAKDLGPELKKHNVGGVTFHAALTQPQVRALVAALMEAPTPGSPRRSLHRRLLERGIDALELQGIFRFRTQEEGEEARLDPAETVRASLRAISEAFDNLAAGRMLNPLPLRHRVVEILDLGPQHPGFWMETPGADPYAQHALTVTLVALLVGRTAGLSQGVLQDLGVSAMLHDMGYAALSSGPGNLERHPGEAARLLLRQRGFQEAKLRRLRTVLDHHRDYAAAGGPPSLAGALLRIAEDYANLLRMWRGRITPADALGAIAGAAGKLYHPVLAQVLVNALGRFPPGTLLELEDGRRVRSISPVRTPATFATPLARIEVPPPPPSAAFVDLAKGGRIVRALPG